MNLSNVSITTTGNSNGLFVTQGGHLVMNGGGITVGGFSAFGMQVVGTNSQVDLGNVAIHVNANASAAATGLLANNISGAGIINASNTTIEVSGATATGAFANGAGTQINLNHDTLQVNGLSISGAGTRANNGGALNISNESSITTSGNTVYGLFLDTASTGIVSNSAISTSGNFSFGTYVQNASHLQLGNTSVLTNGTNAYGMLLNGNSANITLADITSSHLETHGANGIGLFLIQNSQANLLNSQVMTHGMNAPAIETFASGANVTTVHATSSTLSAANSMLIGVEEGNANFNLDHVTANAATGQDFMNVGFDDVANLNFVAAESILSGNIHVLNDSTANLAFLRGTVFTGAIDPANLVIDNTSEWNLTGNSVLNNLTNAGFINFVANGNNFKTLTINNDYIGENGTIKLNTFLGEDDSPSDLIIINGGTAIGSTSLMIHNTTGLGGLTVGNGILVVDAINGGLTNINAFHLGLPVAAGPYDYYLARGSRDGTNAEAWYLRSSFDNPEPPFPPTPLPEDPDIPPLPNPDVPTGMNIPLYRREDSLAAATPSLALLYDHKIIGTLHERVGEQEQTISKKSAATRPFLNGGWFRVYTQDGNFNNNGIYKDGPSFDFNFYAVQLGIDVYHMVYQDGSSDFAGFLGAYGQSTGDVNHLNFVDAGYNNFNAWSVGAYYTHYDPRGWYVDAVLANTFHDINANSRRGYNSLVVNGSGLAGSIESGYHFGLPYGIGIESEAQIVLERLWLTDAHGLGTAFKFDNTNSFVGRIGARLTRTWEVMLFKKPNLITSWVFGNIWREFAGDSRTDFGSPTGDVIFNSNLRTSWSEFGIGINVALTRNVSLYATGNYTDMWNDHGQSGGGEAGVRINF